MGSEDQKQSRKLERERHADNAAAFRKIMALYLKCRYAQPLVSALGSLGRTFQSAYKQRTTEISLLIADIELAITRAIGTDRALLVKFDEWYGGLDDEFIDPPAMNAAEDAALYKRIQQRLGGEFRRRGLYPLSRYFRVPERNRWKELQEGVA